MAARVRIDALADQCGVAPREILKILIDLGQFRYNRFNQQIPDELAARVRERLGPRERRAGSSGGGPEELDMFAQAMSAAGVQRLEPRGQKSKPSKKGKASKRARSKPAASPATVAAPEPPPAPAPPVVEPPPQPEPEAPAVVATPEAAAEPVATEPVVDDHAERLAALEQQHRASLDELTAARAELAKVQGERDELRERTTSLVADGGGLDGGASLMGLLQDRGLRGVDEAGFALRTLLGAHLLDSALPLLVSVEPTRLRRLLHERMCLCCGRDACGAPSGVERVRVPAQRCELCGDQPLPRIHHRFSDAFLLSGITRVVVYGGRRWHRAWLEASADSRVQLRLRSAQPAPLPEVLEDDLAWAQLVLLWNDGSAAHELGPALVERDGPPVRTLEAGSVGGMMACAVEAVEQLDPSELP